MNIPKVLAHVSLRYTIPQTLWKDFLDVSFFSSNYLNMKFAGNGVKYQGSLQDLATAVEKWLARLSPTTGFLYPREDSTLFVFLRTTTFFASRNIRDICFVLTISIKIFDVICFINICEKKI
ncbi:hypothetical protein PPYR_10125 [Photinus pyralis]|uniref:Uncharacterized protein n=1 Tax=Photinus pyralis TaxID=7054 RepID=A0A5N4AFH3_PHOPY|nr:hypothetical protein PPYR_10125 [Photinus pyralis]